MRFIHTGDWHLGKTLNHSSLLEDQEHILQQFLSVVDEEQADAVIVAGDIYDRSVPPVEAVELLDRTLTALLAQRRIPVLLISGNHDSPDRVAFGSRILQEQGLYVAGRLDRIAEPVVLQDAHGPVSFYLVPYAHPAEVRQWTGDETVQDHDSALAALVDRIDAQQPAGRRVLITHGYIRGAESLEESESEKPLSVGGTDYTAAARVAGFDYVALGHLHRPQRVGDGRIRYAGSLLKYSFSEALQAKSVAVVDMDAQGQVTVRTRELSPLRDVRRIRGPLASLLDPAVYQGTAVEDFLQVILTDRGELLEPLAQLRTVYPNVLSLQRESPLGAALEETAAGAGLRQRTPAELFADFYGDVTGGEYTEELAAIIGDLAEQAGRTEQEG